MCVVYCIQPIPKERPDWMKYSTVHPAEDIADQTPLQPVGTTARKLKTAGMGTHVCCAEYRNLKTPIHEATMLPHVRTYVNMLYAKLLPATVAGRIVALCMGAFMFCMYMNMYGTHKKNLSELARRVQ